MTKRLIVRGLMLLICALAALGLFAGSAFADGGITTWAELQAAFNAGGTINVSSPATGGLTFEFTLKAP